MVGRATAETREQPRSIVPPLHHSLTCTTRLSWLSGSLTVSLRSSIEHHLKNLLILGAPAVAQGQRSQNFGIGRRGHRGRCCLSLVGNEGVQLLLLLSTLHDQLTWIGHVLEILVFFQRYAIEGRSDQTVDPFDLPRRRSSTLRPSSSLFSSNESCE